MKNIVKIGNQIVTYVSGLVYHVMRMVKSMDWNFHFPDSSGSVMSVYKNSCLVLRCIQ